MNKRGAQMVSVTRRIKNIEQPRGGYIKAKDFNVTDLVDTNELNSTENISPILIGLTVDYLTRFLNGTSIEKAFEISIQGAINISQFEQASELLMNIKGVDDDSIENACKLVGFDTVYRAGPSTYIPVENITPDKDTIENIRIMVNRGLNFFKIYGPVIKGGFNFEGGYTSLINSGDGDFLTEDTLWDFKVIKTRLTKQHTLQILIYVLMGKESIHSEFQNVKNIGIFNPRLNKVYLLDLESISSEVINKVKMNVIGYN